MVCWERLSITPEKSPLINISKELHQVDRGDLLDITAIQKLLAGFHTKNRRKQFTTELGKTSLCRLKAD